MKIVAQDVNHPTQRLQSLDMLRGMAIVMVLIVHIPLPQGMKSSLESGVIGQFIARLISLGSYGVDLFFVLSGFLISGLLFAELGRTGTLNVPRFWMRRGFKIWPSYFVAYGTVFMLACALELLKNPGTAKNFIANKFLKELPNFLFIQNYVGIENRWFASWSLAIEEHFYLTLPLLLLLLILTKRERLGIPLLCGLVCVMSLSARIYAINSGISSDLIYLQTHFRADSLCFGVLLGYINYYHPEFLLRVPKSIVLMAILILLAVVFPFFYPWGQRVTEMFGLTMMYLCFGGVVTIAAAYPDLGASSSIAGLIKILTRIGTYSYTIYLAQTGALFVAETRLFEKIGSRNLGIDIDSRGLVFIVGSVVGGIILSHLVERPVLSLRERWFPKASKVAITTQIPV